MVCKRTGSNGDRTNDVAPDEEEHYPYVTAAAGGRLLRGSDDSPFSRQLHRTAGLWEARRIRQAITRSGIPFCNFNTHIRDQHSELFLMILVSS
ncbi:unnamed protein product [Heligmosomoides polygyrus]|uniref:Uncharacterized protein n=1 Tax=Heligmosomoides polygyrus TaxID=6339 RepID=A0A183FFW4_HELPZ|nr:unnamed protein product [Heligmosomoides polygyrus]